MEWWLICNDPPCLSLGSFFRYGLKLNSSEKRRAGRDKSRGPPNKSHGHRQPKHCLHAFERKRHMGRDMIPRLAILSMSSAVFLSGCSLTLPVRGVVQGTRETFSGTATGEMDGGGTLSLTSSTGATCTGKFVYVSPRNGSGVFTCSDGRTGPFQFVSTGTRGAGPGDFGGGQRFTFTFG
jgi:hypothetical protein